MLERSPPSPRHCDLRPEVDAALAALVSAVGRKTDRAAAIHAARRAIKVLRALLRLLPGDSTALDRDLKALAGRLAPARDQRVAARTAAAMARRVRDRKAAELLRAIAAEQDEAATSREGRSHAHPRLARLAGTLSAIDTAVAPADVAGVLGKRLRKARRHFAAAMAARDAEALHDARTLVVRLQLQIVALHRVAGRKPGRRAMQLDRLRDLLGEHHDLFMLSGVVAGRHDADPEARARVLRAAERAMRRLEHASEAVADKAFDIGPKAFRNSLRRRLEAVAA
jgi:hypothetical protein